MKSDTRPNFLFIICDELRADALGFAGNPIVQTPNIDRLAQTGTVFTQCMVTQPTCTPSRASILTGCYPSALRSRMVGCVTPDDPRFLPQVLADNGYRTASIGKIHLVPQRAEPSAVQQALDTSRHYYGFQEVDLVNGHGDGCFGPRYTAWLEDHVPDWRERIHQRQAYPNGVNTYSWELPSEVHSSNYIGNRTIKFLQNAGSRPFFLQVSFPDPHYPFTVPEPYASMYDPAKMPLPIPPVTESHELPSLHEQVYFRRNGNITRTDGRPIDRIIGTPPHDYSQLTNADWQQVKAIYYGMVSLIDDQIGRILATLEEQGLAENTVVVVLSDHGDYLGDHGFYGKGLPYDSVLRIPLIWHGPQIVNRQITSVASTLDIAPTLLDLAQVTEPEGIQGQSLASTLIDATPAARSVALTENDDDFVPMKMRVLTTERWKLVYYVNQSDGELYDRHHDPTEMRNLWHHPEYLDIRQKLQSMLLEMVICAQDMRNGRVQSPNPAPPKWSVA